MFGRGRMLASMTIRRTVAAQGYATCLARAKMDPKRADFHALGAFANFRILQRSDLVEMRTAATTHGDFPLLAVAIRS